MRSQGISQFYLHTPHSSANGMNHICPTDQQVLISRSFSGGRHSDENSVEFEVFKTENSNLSEEACGEAPSDAYHSVIQPSLTVTVTAACETRCFY